jgi:hypothetical protein
MQWGRRASGCWRYHWSLYLDIKGFFANIPQDLLIRAVNKHVNEPWMVLYIERWLKAQKFGLQLHPDKTRLIEFARNAAEHVGGLAIANRRRLTLWASRIFADKSESRSVIVKRQTIRKRLSWTLGLRLLESIPKTIFM